VRLIRARRSAKARSALARLSAAFRAASMRGREEKPSAMSTKISREEIDLGNYCSECGRRLRYRYYCHDCGLAF
jgi:hypothetical protein